MLSYITSKLEDIIDPDFGLLDSLLSSRTLTRREFQETKSKSTVYERNGKLLDYVERKDALDQLKTALLETNQEHVENFIKSDGVYREEFGSDWPLTEVETKLLDVNQGKLVDLIDPSELIDYLFSSKVLNSRQHRVLKEKASELEQSEMLIEIWRRTSRSNYRKIIDCLERSEQRHVADILRKGGVVVEVHATLNGEESKVDKSEAEIVESMRLLLKDKTLEERQKIIDLLELENEDICLICIRKSGSIALYFHCTTLQGLLHLQNLLSNGDMKATVEKVFSELLSVKDTITLTIHTSKEEFKNCKAFFTAELTLSTSRSTVTDRKESMNSLGSIERESLVGYTNCCICTQTYSNPKSLPCLHTFCLKCLERYAEHKLPGERIACPVCRRNWKIPVDGVGAFPRNTFVEKLVELGNSPNSIPKETLCDVCQDNSDGDGSVIHPAVKHCIECQQNMCENCAFHHLRQKLSKFHEIISLEGLEEAERAKITSSSCNKHPKKPMVKYCLNCEMTICQICFDESHKGHNSEDVRQVAERMQKDLDDVVDGLATIVEDVEKALKENPRNSFLNHISETESDISARSEQVKKIVDHHKIRLYEYLEIAKKKIYKEFGMEVEDLENHLGELRSFLKLIQELKEQGSNSDITFVGPSLLARAQELQTTHTNLSTKLRNQANWPYTELVPVDIDELLTYNMGNIVGKIRVNCSESQGEDEYYRFSEEFSDSYTDCIYIPRRPSTLRSESTEKNTDEGEVDVEYLQDEGYEAYGQREALVYTSLNADVESEETESTLTRAPPLPPRVKCARGLLKAEAGSLASEEIRPSNVCLVRRLRRGKFTEIWLGRFNQSLDVLIKTFTEEARKETWIVKSCDFFQEADILRQLHHKNIVRLIGVCSMSEPSYVITEMTSKGYLDHYLKEDKGQTVKFKDIINMLSQVAGAMHYLETLQCIHRYLALKSILVGDNNAVKLTNFEMARMLGRRSQQQATTFTDVYELLESPVKTRAPEVIESQRWSVKSDVWSFGILIFQMDTYCGEPYPGMCDSELMTSILDSYDVPCPAGRNFQHPDKKLMTIMQGCWTKDPFRRPNFEYLERFFREYFTRGSAKNIMGYMRRPKAITVIKGKQAVTGIAVYKDEIFLSRYNSTQIETFSGSSFKRGKSIQTSDKKSKFNPLRNLMIKPGVHGEKPNGFQDITPCAKNSCLFVSEWSECKILRISLDSRTVCLSWQVEAGEPSGLSITEDGFLIVCCTSECKICKYSEEGELIHDIIFGCEAEGPRHAIQMDFGRLLVCHGKWDAGQASEGVSIVDMYSGGKCPGTKSIHLLNPTHLCVDSRKQVLVVERGRNRVVVAKPTLESHRVLVAFEQGIHAPTRAHLNETTGHLYVGFQDGTLMVYQAISVVSFSRASSFALDNAESFDDPEYRQNDEDLYECIPDPF